MADVQIVCADIASAAVDLAVLSPAERDRAARFRRPEDAQSWAAARAVLRGVLGARLGVPPQDVVLVTDERGRPRLGGEASGLDFNLSHSGGLALVATSSQCRIGVDIEQRRPVPDLVEVARRVLRPEAVDAIEHAPSAEREAAFFQAWVRHEARLKLRGTGIVEPADDDGRTDDITILDVSVGPHHAAAVAVDGPCGEIDIVGAPGEVTVP